MNHTEHLPGGSVRVSLGHQQAPQQGTAGDPQQVRVYGGSTRVTAGQDAEATSYASHNVTHEGTVGGSIIDTLDRYGSRPSVELVPGNPASRTSVEVAILMGVLKRGPGGHGFEEARQGPQEAAQAPQQGQQQLPQQEAPQAPQQGDELAGVFNPQEDAAFGQDVDAVPEHVFNSAVGAGVRDLVFGGDLKAAESRLVEGGIEPAQAAEHVENARWYFQQMADRAVSKAGVGDELREAFYADLRQDPGRLQNAVQYLTRGRDVSHLQHYAREWLARRR